MTAQDLIQQTVTRSLLGRRVSTAAGPGTVRAVSGGPNFTATLRIELDDGRTTSRMAWAVQVTDAQQKKVN